MLAQAAPKLGLGVSAQALSALGCSVKRLSTAETDLKTVLSEMIPAEQERLKKLKKAHGAKSLGEVTVDMAIRGMRGIPGMLWETSLLDPEEGIRFRGHSIPELQVPTKEQAAAVTEELQERSHVPPHVLKVLNALPKDAHPMSQLSVGVMALQSGSHFAAAYNRGTHKTKYWETVYEDSMDLVAKLPRLAAMIYRRTYKGGEQIQPSHSLDWAGNLAHMMGYEDPGCLEMMRM
ncbi:hypothetical protein GPECTOR_35g881 [Gonium pectorale]|uniref:Citrate synthase n=1 Tax=Gonium pectorale TaxID=33097 RepID=A0A150GCE8_GONPE|nr:hypothetical protein GPECTOR_35g881 [Gonium pectorale]|eukprot:KXZ47443.1 hypothetical protein GPECTOR_35g881 [Gonium pectorale]